ncbi:AI-2E family transporter [Porphyromonas gingivalis]|uniref:AI-2E family transporter n=1 Tax=Porphyromonas gingivalis TaxID=837 RepID=UPI000BE76220|nr:AI-2E family transporter [Porphyromonas gingivalis]PDP64751.1 AI-2E family transporter [Porphyromonas gingivalis]
MQSFFDREFTFDRTARLFFIILLVGGIMAIVIGLRGILIPFCLSWILAYVLMPLVRFVQYRLHFRFRFLSVITVLIFISALIFFAILSLVPAVEEEVSKTITLLQQYRIDENLLQMLPAPIRKFLSESGSMNDLFKGISYEKLMENSKEIFGQLNKLVSGTISLFSYTTIFFIGVLYFIFILFDFEKLGKGFVNLFPVGHRIRVRSILKEVDKNMNSYFRGQALIALCVGILLSIGYKIIDFPLGVTLGLFIGMLNLIPYLQIVGLIPIVFLSVLKAAQTGQNFFVVLALGIGVMMIVQVIQDTILTPNIMGKRMGMSPAMILLSISIWGSLLGFFGLFIALPLTMSLYSVYKRYVIQDPKFIREENEETMPRKGLFRKHSRKEEK